MMSKQNILLNQLAGWQAVLLDHLTDDGGTIQLRLLPGIARPLTSADGTFGGFTNPTGLAVDSQGQIYILDSADNLIKRFDPCLQQFMVLPCIGGAGDAPRQLNAPGGIAISGRDDLYVADAGNWRVQVFSVKGLALRKIIGPYVVSNTGGKITVTSASFARNIAATGASCDVQLSPPAGTWSPADVAVSHSGWLYVADRANDLIHVFDPHLCWRKAFDGASASSPALQKPVRIALDRECRIYVIQEGSDHVVLLDADGNFKANISEPADARGRFCPAAVAVDDQGNIHIAGIYALFQFQANSNGQYCCVSTSQLASSSVGDLIFDHQGNPVVASGKQVLQLPAKAIYEPQGAFISDALDSRIYRCQWHRVVMHGAVATGTQISLDTLTAEETKTPAELFSLPEERWTTSATNSSVDEGDWDCLVQSPPGRYLWLRLRFQSDGKATPCVDRLRIYYPRSSSLKYLPAAYSQDEPSRRFLDQFLSIFDTLWATVGDRLDVIASLFDPMATPAAAKMDFLTWLASWLGLSLDRHWPEDRRRALLKNAWKLYNLRGTPEGLRLHIQLYTGIEPQVLEHFRLRRWLYAGHARLGDQTALWGADIVDRLELNVHSQLGTVQLIDTGDPLTDPFANEAHQFTVFVPQRGAAPLSPQDDALQQQTVQRIIEIAKPAHTLGYLKMTQPRFRIGVQSFIGKDTVVGVYPDQVITGDSKLGYDSALSQSRGEQRPPAGRLGEAARIGTTALIN
jgi:phage tail-like protein